MSLITFHEARKILAETAKPLSPIGLKYSDALGLRLAEDIKADIETPFNDVSAMDGYAVRADDIQSGRPLKVAFETSAGDSPGILPLGQTSRIFTGAAIPSGADSVVMQEYSVPQEDGTVILDPVKHGANLRQRGEIIQKGQVLAKAGDIVTPARIAAFASGGAVNVKVHPKPDITLISTGSELISANEDPKPGQVRNSNKPMLKSLAIREGLDIVSISHSSDKFDELRDVLGNAFQSAELIVTTGGVSVGDYDFIPDVLKKIGADIIFHKVLQKPGKPILAARYKSKWFIGLPGNPVSTFVGWRLYVLPLIAILSGYKDAFETDNFKVRLSSPVANKGKRSLFLPANLYLTDNKLAAEAVPWKGSHDIIASASSNALINLNIGASYSEGDMISCYPYAWQGLLDIFEHHQ
ncbi:MAG: molybdopterin molybdotransferase MoeA [Candidatus Electryonea clarkiae]|nr:molybdopterin molybdotransferase MoeA [Candidatus Electryonea clarkiae]MDP8287785.1 molybdopterin molybdotransferase MoeA [Candidatus Electryonea clarkiae]